MRIPKIIWKTNCFNVSKGFVNGRCLFELDRERRYFIRDLIGEDCRLKQEFDTLEEAREYAAQVFGKFLDQIEY